jgi:hypothetical protein
MGFLTKIRPLTAALGILLLAGSGCSTFHLTLPQVNEPDDWPMDGGNPAHTSAAVDALVPPLSAVWSETLQSGSDRSAVAAAGNTLLITTLHGEVQAFRIDGGEDDGSHRYAPALFGTPVIGGDLVVVAASGT